MLDRQVEFFSNTPDDTHCFQAALKMVLKYFYPEEDYSWEDLDKKTAKVGSLWTWPMAGILWLKEKGMDIKVIEPFDYKKFVEVGGLYLIDEYGEEVGNEQIKHSDIEQERKLAKKYIKKIEIEKRIPELTEIKDYLEAGYLVGCNVNAKKLNNKDGYVGHFIIVKGFNDNNLILHDPGLPPLENRKVDFETFEKAWAYPNEKSKNIMAIKR